MHGYVYLIIFGESETLQFQSIKSICEEIFSTISHTFATEHRHILSMTCLKSNQREYPAMDFSLFSLIFQKSKLKN